MFKCLRKKITVTTSCRSLRIGYQMTTTKLTTKLKLNSHKNKNLKLININRFIDIINIYFCRT